MPLGHYCHFLPVLMLAVALAMLGSYSGLQLQLESQLTIRGSHHDRLLGVKSAFLIFCYRFVCMQV